MGLIEQVKSFRRHDELSVVWQGDERERSYSDAYANLRLFSRVKTGKVIGLEDMRPIVTSIAKDVKVVIRGGLGEYVEGSTWTGRHFDRILDDVSVFELGLTKNRKTQFVTSPERISVFQFKKSDQEDEELERWLTAPTADNIHQRERGDSESDVLGSDIYSAFRSLRFIPNLNPIVEPAPYSIRQTIIEWQAAVKDIFPYMHKPPKHPGGNVPEPQLLPAPIFLDNDGNIRLYASKLKAFGSEQSQGRSR